MQKTLRQAYIEYINQLKGTAYAIDFLFLDAIEKIDDAFNKFHFTIAVSFRTYGTSGWNKCTFVFDKNSSNWFLGAD